MRLQAKNGYKVTAEEIEYDQKQRTPRQTILDRDVTFWMQFVREGQLDTQAILARRYKPSQIPFIQSEFKRLKWLPQ